MSDDTRHKIKLSEREMQMIKESVENTSFFGSFSDEVSRIRKKMTIKEKKTADVTDINQQDGGTD